MERTAINQFNVASVLAALLRADSAIAERVGTRVFPVVAPENTPGDFIIYQRDGYEEQGSKTGLALRSPCVFISCITVGYEAGQQLAARVYDVLMQPGIVAPGVYVRMTDSTEDYYERKFAQVMKFTVTI